MPVLLAQEINATTLPSYFPPARNFTSIGSVTKLLVPALILGGALIFLAMIIYAGYIVLTSQGEAEKIVQARNIFTFSIVGLVLILMSFLIVRIVAFVLNVQTPF